MDFFFSSILLFLSVVGCTQATQQAVFTSSLQDLVSSSFDAAVSRQGVGVGGD